MDSLFKKVILRKELVWSLVPMENQTFSLSCFNFKMFVKTSLDNSKLCVGHMSLVFEGEFGVQVKTWKS